MKHLPTEFTKGTRVVTTAIPEGYTPPSTSMDPAAIGGNFTLDARRILARTEFEVVSSRSDPFVSLECTACGTVLDSAEADEHAELHESAAEAEQSGGLAGLVAWFLANKGWR